MCAPGHGPSSAPNPRRRRWFQPAGRTSTYKARRFGVCSRKVTQLPSIRWRTHSKRSGENSICAGQIRNNAMNNPAMSHEQVAQRLALAIRKLDEQTAAGLQELGRPLRKGAMKFEAVSAAVQRQARI